MPNDPLSRSNNRNNNNKSPKKAKPKTSKKKKLRVNALGGHCFSLWQSPSFVHLAGICSSWSVVSGCLQPIWTKQQLMRHRKYMIAMAN